MSEDNVIEILKAYIAELNQNGIPIDKAFLYGSFSRNEQNDESDIDLMLVSKTFDSYNEKTIGAVWNLTTNFDSRIEPYIVGAQRFETDEISPLLQIVKAEGIRIC